MKRKLILIVVMASFFFFGCTDNKGETSPAIAEKDKTESATSVTTEKDSTDKESTEIKKAEEKIQDALSVVLNEPRWINSPEGLRMRDDPTLSGNKLLSVPHGEPVTLLEETGETITIQDGTGKWSKVRWKEHVGWVFGGFLSNEEIVTVREQVKNAPIDPELSPLFWEAFIAADTEKVTSLIRRGADINAIHYDEWDEAGSPLFWMILRGSTEIAKLLILEGVDVTIGSPGGYTPLSLAISKGDVEIIKMIIDAGAETGLKDYYGWTPLMESIYIVHHNHEVIRSIIYSGADINAKTDLDRQIHFRDHGYITFKAGSTALSIARRLDKTDVARLLKNAGAVEQ